MINNIDYESLRKDLMDYFGTATPLFPMAVMGFIEIESASNCELINIAVYNGFNLSDYEINKKVKKHNRDLF